MASRVLTQSAEVQPVPWLKNRPAIPVARPASGEDGSPLRARITELEAAMESKAGQSYEAGVRDGAEAARAQLEAQVQTAVQRLADTIADLAGTRAETIRRAEGDTVRLAIEIARRVLHRELTMDFTALESLVKAALEKLQAQEVYRVRVHPAQERTVKACLEQTGRGQAIGVVPDPTLAEGGVIFEIGRGSMDASVDTQLAEIERGLIDQLETRA
jgi:flagellar assembly protein FliH